MDKAVTIEQLENALESTLRLLKGEFGDGGGGDGSVWRPTVTASGELSWEKSKEVVAPDPVNIMGPPGEAGRTPVKGTDYWTAEDRNGIVDDVLAALPEWTGGSY